MIRISEEKSRIIGIELLIKNISKENTTVFFFFFKGGILIGKSPRVGETEVTTFPHRINENDYT